MPTPYTKEEIERAKTADLYAFLIAKHADIITREGDTIRLKLKNRNSVVVKRGYICAFDFSTEEKITAINLLINDLNYTFLTAVEALLQFTTTNNSVSTISNNSRQQDNRERQPIPAAVANTLHIRLYLNEERAISSDIIEDLINRKILFEDAKQNAVFANIKRTFAEIRGTCINKSFHATRVPTGDKTAFWYYKPTTAKNAVIYICESAIDAISLYQLKRLKSPVEAQKSIYVSIAGTGNDQRIKFILERAKNTDLQIVLAVDNDEAGNKCRERFKTIDTITPTYKDWNEDLKKFK